MTTEQREAIEYLKESVLIYKNTIPKISEAIDTVLNMLKEKNEQIEGQKCVIETQAHNEEVLVKQLEKKDRQIDLMANYIVNLIKYNNPEEIREVEELKQYFERKSEK